MLPRDIGMNSELRELLIEFSTGQEERARIARDTLLEIENTLKGDKGRLAALVDPAIIRSRALSEQTQRAIVATDISLQKDFGAIWDNVRSTREYYRSIRDRYAYTEYGYGFRSQLFDFAKSLVRYAAEAKKPDEARLPEFTEFEFS